MKMKSSYRLITSRMAGRALVAGFGLLVLASCSSSEDDLELDLDDRSTSAQSTEFESTEFESTEFESTEIALSVPSVPATGAATITDLVLITGQSNALGSLTAFDRVLDQPVDGFFAYTDQGWRQANLRQIWDLGTHPKFGLGDDPHNNFGFHFGKTIAERRSDRVVGIILASAPGEGISHWDADKFFYNQIRSKVLLAVNELPHKSGVDGILWHQGETDWTLDGSDDPDIEGIPNNDYYSQRFWQLITNFRSESWFASDRPFICGETARSPVNSRLNALNRDSDIWTACVPGEGLPTYDEERVHFSAEGLRQLGKNYAEVYLQMTSR